MLAAIVARGWHNTASRECRYTRSRRPIQMFRPLSKGIPRMTVIAKEAAAEHGRERKGRKTREQDRNRNRDSEFPQRRPSTPLRKRMGRNTATSDTVMETIVKPTSLAPSRAACMRLFPIS